GCFIVDDTGNGGELCDPVNTIIDCTFVTEPDNCLEIMTLTNGCGNNGYKCTDLIFDVASLLACPAIGGSQNLADCVDNDPTIVPRLEFEITQGSGCNAGANSPNVYNENCENQIGSTVIIQADGDIDADVPLSNSGNIQYTVCTSSNNLSLAGLVISADGCCEFMATCNLDPAPQDIAGCSAAVIPAAETNFNNVFTAIGPDPCGTLTMISSTSSTGALCDGDLIVTRTYTLFDDLAPTNGMLDPDEESETCSESFRILPPDLTVDCPMSVSLGACATETEISDAYATWSAGFAVNDGCNAMSNIGDVPALPVFVCGGAVNLDFTLSATDDCNVDPLTCNSTFTVAELDDFVITCPPSMTLTCFETVPAPINNAEDFIAAGGTLSDACSDEFTFFTTNENNGGNNCPGNPLIVTRTYFVTDICGNQSSCTQVFTYLESTNGPIITDIAPECYKYCGSLANPMESDVTYTTDCSFGATVEITGPDIIGTPDCPGTRYRYIYTVTDDCGRSTSATRDFIIGNEGPTIECPPFNLILNCGDENNMDYINTHLGLATANSSCQVDVDITYSPSNFNNITCGNATVVTFIATDACGRTATCVTTISVIDNTPPTITSVPPSVCDQINCSADINYWYTHWIEYMENGLSAIDDCDNDVIFQAENIPLNTSCNEGEAITTVTFTATDNCGNSTSYTGTFTIDNEVPEFTTVPMDQAVDCGEPAIFGTPTFSDDCSTAVLTFEDEVVGDNCTGSITRIWTITDDCGNTASASTTITFGNTPPEGPQLHGHIYTEQGLMVENVDVMLGQGNSMNHYMTQDDGYYIFDSLTQGLNFEIMPFCDIDYLNGISSYDLVLISKHILQLELLDSPYKMIAADINQSGSITTFDIVELRKLILHNIETFSDNTSWKFVEAAFVFPEPTNPFSTIFPEEISINGLFGEEEHDFIGVKIGDVNGSVIPSAMAENDPRNFEGSLVFEIEDKGIETGEEFEVEFKARDFNQIIGFQYALKFDHKSLDFISVEADGLTTLSEANFGFRFLEEGVITTSWHNMEAVTMHNETAVFRMKFKAVRSGKLSDWFDLSSKYTKAEAYTEFTNDGEVELLQPELRFNDQLISSDELVLYQNRPNPFRDETVISFNLPEASSASIKIFDTSFRVVREITGDFEKGYNEVIVSRNDLLSAGLYYYQLNSNNRLQTMKMVILK
ncbi:MAG: T9SS type A sorting domain-containing protein, partial [Saprospiraceae bacterium]